MSFFYISLQKNIMEDRSNVEILKEFYDFLREKGALIAYKQNFFHFRQYGSWIRLHTKKYDSPMPILLKLGPSELIDSAFLWAQTKQGYSYWCILEDIWKSDYC